MLKDAYAYGLIPNDIRKDLMNEPGRQQWSFPLCELYGGEGAKSGQLQAAARTRFSVRGTGAQTGIQRGNHPEQNGGGNNRSRHGICIYFSFWEDEKKGTLLTSLKRMCYSASVPAISFHTLRHQFATMLIEKGIPLEDISRLLGHKCTVYIKRQLGRNIMGKAISAATATEGLLTGPVFSAIFMF